MTSALHFALAFGLSYASLVNYKHMGLITDLLKESPLKAPQLESIALIEKRMQEEKIAAVSEAERLKTELDHVRSEMQQTRSLVRVLEQEVAQWRRQARSREDGPFDQPGADAGS